MHTQNALRSRPNLYLHAMLAQRCQVGGPAVIYMDRKRFD